MDYIQNFASTHPQQRALNRISLGQIFFKKKPLVSNLDPHLDIVRKRLCITLYQQTHPVVPQPTAKELQATAANLQVSAIAQLPA